jgi:rsbT co-antagonist protein RsbR
MLSQLRTRLLISTLLTVGIVIGLLSFIVIERLGLNEEVMELSQVASAAGQARELSLYVQYNAHDTNAYTLGHTEHLQEFVEHEASFNAIVGHIQQHIDAGILEDDEQVVLDQIKQVRLSYDQASQELFTAADLNRAAPSAANQAQENMAWEAADQLVDQLDDVSQTLAGHISEDVETRQAQIAARNRQVVILIVVLGVAIVALSLFIQWLAASAVGLPLQTLLSGVQRFASGDLQARVNIQRHDEVGSLTKAFNAMAETLQRQTQDLQAQYAAAQAAQEEAETARSQVSAQLATIQTQQETLREMSVPILPLTNSALMMPLVGALDTARLLQVQEQALRRIKQLAVRYLILDITGVPVIDTQVGQGLIQVIQAVRLLGSEVILVGIRPEVAQTIVGLGIRLDNVLTRSSLQSGIAYALSKQ